MKFEPGDIVTYIGPSHKVLELKEDYEVFSSSSTGVQVKTKTGFAGVDKKYFTLKWKQSDDN